MLFQPQNHPGIADRQLHTVGVQYDAKPGLGLDEQFRRTTAFCNTSTTHTYGNVLSVIEKKIIDTFPQNVFKTITASTTLASFQVRHLPHQLYKKECPMMLLVPRIEFGQDDRFLGGTLLNTPLPTRATWGEGSMPELARDLKRGLYVYGQFNRALMFVDVVLSFNTQPEQINWLAYMYQNFQIERVPPQIVAPLELYIPRSFCELVSQLTNQPIYDENHSVYNFMKMMNGMFHNPITYKLKGGSNTDEFFMYHLTGVDWRFLEKPTQGQGVKDGQMRRNFDISFTIRCEFNTYASFLLESPDIKKQVFLPDDENDKTVVPIFSDQIDLKDFNLPIGWSILSWPIFKLSYGESSISIDGILNDSLRVVIDHHLKCGMPMDQFIRIQFRENGQILSNEMFYIDWHTRTLHLQRPDTHRTYRLIITVSADYVNEMVKKLYGLE